MGIIVDPAAIPGSGPGSTTSIDGLLVATRDDSHAGVLLQADLTGEAVANQIRNGSFTSAISGADWVGINGSTLTRLTSGGAGGDANHVRVDTASSPTGNLGIVQPLTKPIYPGGKALISFYVKFDATNQPDSLYIQLRNSGRRIRDIALTTVMTTIYQQVTVLIDMKPEDMAANEFILYGRRTSGGAGAVLRIFFSKITMKLYPPIGVLFTRSIGGVDSAVRGGDFKWTVSGYAQAYDGEAPVGASVSYRAIAIYTPDGLSQGASTAPVSITTAEPAGTPADPSTWVRSIENPSNSVQVMINDWHEFGASSSYSSSRVSGRSLGSVTWDAMLGLTGEMKVITQTEEEADKMFAMVTEGLVLIESGKQFRRPTMYVVIDSWACADFVTMKEEHRIWTLNFTQQDRPETFGQPNRMPNSSFAKRFASYPTFSLVPVRTFAEGVQL